MPSADIHVMPGPGADALDADVRARVDAVTEALGLSGASAKSFREAARFIRLELDDPVVFEGEVRGVVFWLVEGRLSFFADRRPLFTLDAGDALARRALETRSPFRFTIKAIAPARVMMLSQMVLDQCLENRIGCDAPLPEPVSTLVAAHEARRFDAPLERVLLSPVLQSLKPTEIERLVAEMPREECAVNETRHLAAEAPGGKDLIVVESGFLEVAVFVADEAGRQRDSVGSHAAPALGVAPVFREDLGPGDLFGEQNLLGEDGFSVQLTWLTPGVLRRIPAQTFESRLKARFVEPIAPPEAEALLARAEAQLLDVGRGMAELDVGPDRTLHLPLHWLPRRLRNLDPKRQYILMADTDAEAEFAAFYLTTRGIRARPLVHPEAVLSPEPPDATPEDALPDAPDAAASTDRTTPAPSSDPMAQLFAEFEARIRARLSAESQADRARLARAYARAVTKIQREAHARVHAKAADIKREYAARLVDLERRLARDSATPAQPTGENETDR